MISTEEWIRDKGLRNEILIGSKTKPIYLDALLEEFKTELVKKLTIPVVVARASYNKHRGWDVFGKKVVRYAYVEEDGAVMKINGMCVGNYIAEDFLLHVP
jgi:hypothetical protein